MKRSLLVLLAAALLLPFPAAAQGPDAHWKILATAHFRVHYPAPSEAWARRTAAVLESIWARVQEEVGYRPPEIVDVVVSDPVAEANGAALPILGWPRLILWTSPPGPESVIGHYLDWSELLLVHEGTHLAHLLRPSRNPAERALARLVPLGPVAKKAPRWVTEGYATLVEGRLTASGRPNGDLRAALLRRRAQAGKLPPYGALNGDRSWHGYSMAYLMGSAYLEWLEGRAGPGSLAKLWARLSARRNRSFDKAFSGVFGDRPADLYDRFTAELTGRAMEAEKRIAPIERAGSLWQRLERDAGAPALSPDGEEIALVLRDPRHRERPAELVVWSTGPPDEEEKRWQKERQRIAAEDPADVPAVRTRPLSRKPLHRLPSIDGVEPTTPRFLPDGKSVLFVRFEPDGQGFLHPDLFRWETAGERIERLTRQADLRDPDPAPKGDWAVAVRDRDGFSQLVRVDLRSGTVEALTEPAVDVVYDHPRVSPDGGRIAFARHRDGAWELVVRDLASDAETILAGTAADGMVASPAWSADGRTLFAVLGRGGFIDVGAFAAAGAGPAVAVTLTQGGALAPAPTPDGKGLFYLGLEADGLDLYRLDLPAPPLPAANLPVMPELAPAVRPAPRTMPPPFARAEPPPGRDERFGRQEALALASGQASSAGGAFEVGARGGDLLGRIDYLALGSLAGAGGPQGAALAAAWRGWPVALSFHLFYSTEHPSRQSGRVPAAAGALDFRQDGVEARARWERRLGPAELTLSAGGLWSRGSLAFVDALYGARRSRGTWWWDEGARAHWEHGWTDGDPWDRYGGTVLLGMGRGEDGVVLSYRRDGSESTVRPGDRYELGGVPTSILPESALAGRILVPALPLGTALGTEHEAERAEIHLGFLPAPLFYERHRLWSPGERGDWLALTGLEWRFALGPQPIARLPAFDLRLGVARVLDAPYKGDTRWWLVTVLRP